MPFCPSAFVSREGSLGAAFVKDAFAVLVWCSSVNYQGGCALGKIRCITRDGIKANLKAKCQYCSALLSLEHIFVHVFR